MPDRVRKAPKGGWMWKCDVEGCNRIACHITPKKVKVCSRHGGSTARQRDATAKAKAAARGERIPKPPGRPVKHGFYSTVPGVRVDELVAEYRERKLNVDATEEDMLYLRAYLDELKTMRPDALVVAESLKKSIETVDNWMKKNTDVVDDAKGGAALNVGEVLKQLGAYSDLNADLKELRMLLKALLEITAGVEKRHERLVMLAKVRSETRLKDSAAAQLDAFTTMLERLDTILTETLPSHYRDAVTARFEKELTELPGNGIKIKT